MLKSREDLLQEVANKLEASSLLEVNDRLDGKLRELKESKAEIEKLDQEIAHNLARELESQALYPKGYPVIIGLLDDVDKSLPLKILDLLKSRHSQYFIYLIIRMKNVWPVSRL